MENLVKIKLDAVENERHWICTLERKVEQLTRPSSSSLGTISDTHHGSDFDNDNVLGTFSIFEAIEASTAARCAFTITKRNSGPNAGLMNSGNLCYSNAIFQAFASCKQITTLFGNPSPENHDNIQLCYKFTTYAIKFDDD